MAHKLLQALDNEHKAKRAQLIARNYDAIVGEIHHFFQTEIIHKVDTEVKVKEIVKFDYMTNVNSNGDKHLWINFIDNENHLHTLQIVLDDLEAKCIYNSSTFLLKELQLSLTTIEHFSKLCLNEFRRGYDKPEIILKRNLSNLILKPQLKKGPSEEAIEAAFQTALKADKEASNEPTNRFKDLTDEEFLVLLKTMFEDGDDSL